MYNSSTLILELLKQIIEQFQRLKSTRNVFILPLGNKLITSKHDIPFQKQIH